jgi:hypothetical protein
VPPSSHTLLFVGGLHHSGTTLLARALRQHPAISGLRDTGVPEDEGQHLQSVIPAAADLGGPGHFGLHPDGPLTGSDPRATPDAAQRLMASWQPHWELDRPVLMEKSPPNLIRGRFLQALFPGARLLLIVRHPLAMAYGTRGPRGPSLRALLAHGAACHRRMLADLPHLDHARVLQFEELLADPDGVLAGIHRWLGLSPEPNVLHVRPDANRRHLDRWARLQQGALTRGLAARLCAEYEAPARRLGYSLQRPEELTPFPGAGDNNPT